MEGSEPKHQPITMISSTNIDNGKKAKADTMSDCPDVVATSMERKSLSDRQQQRSKNKIRVFYR
jgi:hypothetical protein